MADTPPQRLFLPPDRAGARIPEGFFAGTTGPCGVEGGGDADLPGCALAGACRFLTQSFLPVESRVFERAGVGGWVLTSVGGHKAAGLGVLNVIPRTPLHLPEKQAGVLRVSRPLPNSRKTRTPESTGPLGGSLEPFPLSRHLCRRPLKGVRLAVRDSPPSAYGSSIRYALNVFWYLFWVKKFLAMG